MSPVILFFYLFLFLASNTVFAANKCENKIQNKIQNTIANLNSKGYDFLLDCVNDNPHLYVAIVSLDDSRNKIKVAFDPKIGNIEDNSNLKKGNLLTDISTHAKRENAIIAVNGFNWSANGTNTNRGVAKLVNQYGKPRVTVYSDGDQKYEKSKGEALIAFSTRTFSGTSSKFYDRGNRVEAIPKIEEKYKVNIDGSTFSIMKNGVLQHANVVNKNRWSSIGIGKLGDINVLVILSSNGNYTDKSNHTEHFKIFEVLGVKNAIRLDGGPSASLYYNGEHMNELSLIYDLYGYGDARKILYALTVTRVESIEPFSLPQFNNMDINDSVSFSDKIYFSGNITSESGLSKITINITKPNGEKKVDGSWSQNGIRNKDMSVYHFGQGGYVDMLGMYKIDIIAENTDGIKSSKTLSIEVIPKITSAELTPNKPFKGNDFDVVFTGEKLQSDIKTTIATDDTPCTLIYKHEKSAKFQCPAYNAGNFRMRVYYKNANYVIYEKQHDYIECYSRETQDKSCSNIVNGNNTQERICSDRGIWGNYGSCYLTCDNGYHQSRNSCIADSNPQVCIPNEREALACLISNGTGLNARSCASDGLSWNAYEGCKVSQCNSGYIVSGNTCIAQTINPTYDFYLRNERLNKTSVLAGGQITAYVDAYYSGNVLDSDMGSVRTGYYLSTNSRFDSNDIFLDDDNSSLGSDDRYDSESQILTIPSSLPSGSYYILFVADNDKRFSETNENNNVEYVRINISGNETSTYDFYIKNAESNKTSAFPGDSISLSMDVYYSGNVLDRDMGGVKTSYYLVSVSNEKITYKEVLGSDDSYLGFDDEYDSESLTFNLLGVLTPGIYYVIFATDDDEQYAETNEGNNVALVQIEIKPVKPSISRLSPSSPKVYPQGSFTRRTVYIYGDNFKIGASVKMCWSTACSTLVSGYSSKKSYSKVETSKKIKIYFSPGYNASNWNITITNPDGGVGDTFFFSTSN